MSECGDKVAAEHGEVSKQEAEQMLLEIRNQARLRESRAGVTHEEAIKQVTAEFQARDRAAAAVDLRNNMMDVKAQRSLVDFAKRAPTYGEGLVARLVGSAKTNFKGAGESVDSVFKDLQHRWYGGVTAAIESAKAFREFRTNSVVRQVYQEMEKPGSSKSEKAAAIAAAMGSLYKDMNARFNDAGGFRGDMPGYTAMQTHDMYKIRGAGATKQEAYQVWKSFILPKLDQERTFLGADPEKWLRNVHDSLYSGVHGVMGQDGAATGNFGGDMARKGSQERVIHFKDGDSAYDYNQKFGQRDLKEQLLSTTTNNARSIALMEMAGPNAERNIMVALRQLKEDARDLPEDNIKHLDSLNEKKVMSAYREVTGANAIPSNPNVTRVIGNIKAVAQLSKMGSVGLTKFFADKAFMQSEMAYQGISHMTTLAKQVTTLAKRTPDQMQALRLMGVGLDGLMGNALSRFSTEGPVSGTIDRFQKRFFDINFLNAITDAHKQGAGELMAAHLGEHAGMEWGQLPGTLAKLLDHYDIDKGEWDKIRGTAWDSPSGQKYVTADGIDRSELSTEDKRGLSSKLGSYFADRIDTAVPTPGAAERMIVNMDTKAGTPVGEGVRLMMLFKSFPITIANKVIKRDFYGNGSNTIGHWALNDHQGKFNMATMIAMATISGYIGMSIKDALNGKTPQELMSDGKVNWDVMNRAAVHGGGVGLMGEMIMRDYERGTSSFLENAAGPVLGQLDPLSQLTTKLKKGEDATQDIKRMTIDNSPLINLFYVRPVLNYYVLWNLEQMMSPGAGRRMQDAAEKNHQSYFTDPSR